MRKRLSSMTRRSVIGALVGLAFAAAAGVGLAQVTTGSTPSTVASSTTESQTTSTQTTGDFEGKSADDQESEENDFDSDGKKNKHQSSTTLSTTTTTTPLTTSTTGEAVGAAGNGQAKMDVCHKTGSGKEHTINIAAPAVPAHEAHGDTLGACAVVAAATTSTQSTTTTAAVTTTATTSSGQK